MAAPYWVTDAGSLGTIQEQEFYNLQLVGRDPEEASNNTGLTFSLLAGKLPGGIAMASTGLIDGIPTQRSKVKGIPYEVSENITSEFVIRITDAESLIADRTFTLTVAGPDSPVWATAEGKLLDTHDGEEINLTVSATDSDEDDLTYTVTDGLLPPGLVLNSSTGALTGRITKISKTTDYVFTVTVTDGVYTITRQFNIIVHALIAGSADTEEDDLGSNITCDSTNNMWLADVYKFARPWMSSLANTIGSYKHDNYYIEKLEGELMEDLPSIAFEKTGNFPSMLTFDGAYDADATDSKGSCLIYGTIPSQTATEINYTFSVRPLNTLTDNDYSPPKAITIYGPYIEYTLSIEGDSKTEVIWS